MIKFYQGKNIISDTNNLLTEEQLKAINSVQYKVDKDGNKVLSENDFTDECKNKLEASSLYIGHFNSISERNNYNKPLISGVWCSVQVDENYSNKETKYVYNDSNWVFNGYYTSNNSSVELSLDDTPTEGSRNGVTSGGVFNALKDISVNADLSDYYKKEYIDNKLYDKEDKSNKVTILNKDNTDNQYPSAKVVYDNCIKNNNLKTYTDVTQLDLTSITSINEIFNAMEDNSLGIFECNGIVSDTPAEYGTLIIEKKNTARFNLLFKLSSQDEVLDNTLYVGSLKGLDGTGVIWNKIISSNMVATTLSSDVTNEQVLSAKCVYDNYLSTGKILEENTDWNTLTTGTYKIIGDRISTFTNSLFDTFPNEYPYGDLIVSKSGLIWHMMYIPNGNGLKDDNTSYETNVVVMAGRDTGESGIWFKLASYNDLKKRVEDTSWVTKTVSNNFSNGNVYYRKKDGRCDVYVENLIIGSSGVSSSTIICSGLPTPEVSMWTSISKDDGSTNMLVKPNINGDLVTYTGTQGSYYGHFTYIVKE